MKSERVSGGSAVLAQVMTLLFFLPFVSFLAYIIISKNRSPEGVGFLVIVMIIAFLICRNALSYADIFVSSDTIVMKKVWGSRQKPISEYKSIEKALLPFTFYIEFNNSKKVYFFSPLSEIWGGLTSSDPDKDLKVLRLRFKKEHAV